MSGQTKKPPSAGVVFLWCTRRRTFLTGESLESARLDKILHFATVSYAFCRRLPPELSEEIFSHILNKALNNRMVDPSITFIDGTHIKASANKKKYQKQWVAETAKVYAEQLQKEVNEEREKMGKKPIEEGDDDENPPKGGGSREKTVSTTDPDCGMFVKGGT